MFSFGNYLDFHATIVSVRPADLVKVLRIFQPIIEKVTFFLIKRFESYVCKF